MIYFDEKQDGWVSLSDKNFWYPIEKAEEAGVSLMESEKHLKFENEKYFFHWLKHFSSKIVKL